MKCFHRRFTVPDRTGKARCLREIQAALAEERESQYAEIWIDHGNFPALCALMNDTRGWLMCLRFEGDAGFSSRNPAYKGEPRAEIDFVLSNGQRDKYPASWAFPVEEVFAALEWFAAHKAVPSSIAWYNDSGDGNASPNDPFVIPR